MLKDPNHATIPTMRRSQSCTNPQTHHPQSSPPTPRLRRLIIDEAQEEAMQFKLREKIFRRFTLWAVGDLPGFPLKLGLAVTWLFLSGSMTPGIRKYVLAVKGLDENGVGRDLVVRVGVAKNDKSVCANSNICYETRGGEEVSKDDVYQEVAAIAKEWCGLHGKSIMVAVLYTSDCGVFKALALTG